MPVFSPRAADALTTAVSGALSLIFPTWCAGCDLPDTALCASCRASLRPAVLTRTVGPLVVHAGLTFSGVPARVLRAGKEDGRTALLSALAPALAAAAEAPLALAPAGERVIVVPLPTSPSALRRRGYRVVDLLAARAGLHPQRLLGAAGRAADQRGLGAAARERNVAGTLRVLPRRAAHLEGRAVLVVDDVVTTGATLREATRALAAAGAHVIGAATVASTPLHTGRRAFVTATDR